MQVNDYSNKRKMLGYYQRKIICKKTALHVTTIITRAVKTTYKLTHKKTIKHTKQTGKIYYSVHKLLILYVFIIAVGCLSTGL